MQFTSKYFLFINFPNIYCRNQDNNNNNNQKLNVIKLYINKNLDFYKK